MGLDTVELIIAFEKEFDLEIDHSEASILQTPGRVIDWVERELRRLGRPMPRDNIAESVKRVTLSQSGVSERFYREDARFVGDFCMD